MNEKPTVHNVPPLIPEPKGKRLMYAFENGSFLHLFDVRESDLSGARHYITNGAGEEYEIDIAKVLYIAAKMVE